MKYFDWLGDVREDHVPRQALKDLQLLDPLDYSSATPGLYAALVEETLDEVLPDYEFLVAYYAYEDYSGAAIVVYRDKRDGKVYEVNGSHCSCHGLEGQWKPEEVVSAELLNRPKYVYVWYAGAEEDPNEKIREALKSELGNA